MMPQEVLDYVWAALWILGFLLALSMKWFPKWYHKQELRLRRYVRRSFFA